MNGIIDICEQSIFINDLRTTTVSMNNKEATIDIGNVMKIVGFSIQGITRSTNFTLKYSSSDSLHDLKPVYQTSENNFTRRVSYDCSDAICNKIRNFWTIVTNYVCELLQIASVLFITICVDSLLQITLAFLLHFTSSLLQITLINTNYVSFITNCVFYYKLGQNNY